MDGNGESQIEECPWLDLCGSSLGTIGIKDDEDDKVVGCKDWETIGNVGLACLELLV